MSTRSRRLTHSPLGGRNCLARAAAAKSSYYLWHKTLVGACTFENVACVSEGGERETERDERRTKKCGAFDDTFCSLQGLFSLAARLSPALALTEGILLQLHNKAAPTCEYGNQPSPCQVLTNEPRERRRHSQHPGQMEAVLVSPAVLAYDYPQVQSQLP